MVGTTSRNTGVEGVEGGVGLTALLVAAARAIETHRRDTLARDIYAEHFVLAAPASMRLAGPDTTGSGRRYQPTVGPFRALLRSADEGPRRLSPPICTHG